MSNPRLTKTETQKHTPGPWQVEPDYDEANVYRLWDESGNTDNPDLRTMDANAALMQAAPELLFALRAIVAADNIGDPCPALGPARAAIARAEGGAS